MKTKTDLVSPQRQTIHSDVEFAINSRRIFTTFVALQNIDEDMGPTEIWPGTHSEYFCSFYKPFMLGPVDSYYIEHPPELMKLRAGDAVIIDTRVMHCGGKNISNVDRLLFHFSWETSEEPDAPVGFTYNLVPDLKARWHFKDFLTDNGYS